MISHKLQKKWRKHIGLVTFSLSNFEKNSDKMNFYKGQPLVNENWGFNLSKRSLVERENLTGLERQSVLNYMHVLSQILIFPPEQSRPRTPSKFCFSTNSSPRRNKVFPTWPAWDFYIFLKESVSFEVGNSQRGERKFWKDSTQFQRIKIWWHCPWKF